MHHHSLLTLFSIPAQRRPFAYTTPSSINLLHEIFCIAWFCGISWTSGHCQTLTARPSCQLPRRGHRGIFHCSGTWRPITQLLSINQGFSHQMMGYTSKVGSVPELQAARWSSLSPKLKAGSEKRDRYSFAWGPSIREGQAAFCLCYVGTLPRERCLGGKIWLGWKNSS